MVVIGWEEVCETQHNRNWILGWHGFGLWYCHLWLLKPEYGGRAQSANVHVLVCLLPLHLTGDERVAQIKSTK